MVDSCIRTQLQSSAVKKNVLGIDTMLNIRKDMQLTSAGGRISKFEKASFGATHQIVLDRYDETFEVARVIAKSWEGVLTVRYKAIPLEALVGFLQGVVVSASSALHHLSHTGPRVLATFIGPLIGHFDAIREIDIPAVLAAAVTVGQRKSDIFKINKNLRDLQPTVDALTTEAKKWNFTSPKVAFDTALHSSFEALGSLID